MARESIAIISTGAASQQGAITNVELASHSKKLSVGAPYILTFLKDELATFEVCPRAG